MSARLTRLQLTVAASLGVTAAHAVVHRPDTDREALAAETATHHAMQVAAVAGLPRTTASHFVDATVASALRTLAQLRTTGGQS